MPFRDCFTGSEVVAEIVARADREPIIGSYEPAPQEQPQQQRGHEAPPISARRAKPASGASPLARNATPAGAERRAGSGTGVLDATSHRGAGGRCLSRRPVKYRVGSIGGRAR
jgi:hypothetical protein